MSEQVMHLTQSVVRLVDLKGEVTFETLIHKGEKTGFDPEDYEGYRSVQFLGSETVKVPEESLLAALLALSPHTGDHDPLITKVFAGFSNRTAKIMSQHKSAE